MRAHARRARSASCDATSAGVGGGRRGRRIRGAPRWGDCGGRRRSAAVGVIQHVGGVKALQAIDLCLPADVVDRVDRLRRLAGVDAARPSESATLLALVRRGLESVEREHGLGPLAAGLPRGGLGKSWNFSPGGFDLDESSAAPTGPTSRRSPRSGSRGSGSGTGRSRSPTSRASRWTARRFTGCARRSWNDAEPRSRSTILGPLTTATTPRPSKRSSSTSFSTSRRRSSPEPAASSPRSSSSTSSPPTSFTASARQ